MQRGRPGNSAERVRRYLERRIVQGLFKPRERLTELEICRATGVSRSPVREALRQLVSDGLVEFHARRGARVTDVSLPEILEVFQVFEALESLSVGLAAGRMRGQTLRRLADILARMQQAVEAGDLRAYFHLNARFHGAIYRASGNAKLAQLLLNLGKQITRFRFAALATPGRMATSLREHRALTAAFRRRDEKAAERLARTSVANARRALIASLGFSDNSGSDVTG